MNRKEKQKGDKRKKEQFIGAYWWVECIVYQLSCIGISVGTWFCATLLYHMPNCMAFQGAY